MDKVIELALEAGMCIEHPDECDVVSHEELTKFYELARAELEAEIIELREANEAFGKRQEWWTERMCDLEAENEQLRKERQAFKDVAEYQKAENAKLREALAQQGEPVASRFEAMHANGDVWITTLAAAAIARSTAAPAAQPTCKQDLQVPTVKESLSVETTQERYVRLCPDIECGRKKQCTRMVGVSCMSRADIAAAPAAQPDTWTDDGGWTFPIERPAQPIYVMGHYAGEGRVLPPVSLPPDVFSKPVVECPNLNKGETDA